jgi:hypothetical protein
VVGEAGNVMLGLMNFSPIQTWRSAIKARTMSWSQGRHWVDHSACTRLDEPLRFHLPNRGELVKPERAGCAATFLLAGFAFRWGIDHLKRCGVARGRAD